MARIVETKTHYQDKPPCRTAKQMTTLCCEDTAALQCCETVEPWDGYSDQEILDRVGLKVDAKGRDQQGRYVRILRQERKKPCGEKRTIYDLSQNNCCDQVEPLAWDMDITPDVLPHGSSIIIAWQGSDGRQTEVRTSSNGTHFSDGRKTAIGHGSSIELFAGDTFCGATQVTVRDGCSEATVLIRSDLGHWQFVGYTCGLSDREGTLIGTDSYSNRIVEEISGAYKQLDYQTPKDSYHAGLYFGAIYNHPNISGAPCPAMASSACVNVESTLDHHCDCAFAAGAGVPAGPLCLAANTAGITKHHECTPGAWMNMAGAIGFSCYYPGGSSFGSLTGYVMHHLEGGSRPPELYQWVC